MEARTLGNPLGGVSGPPVGSGWLTSRQAQSNLGQGVYRSPGRCGMAESTSQPQGTSVRGRMGSWVKEGRVLVCPQGPPASVHHPHLPKLHLGNKSTNHCQVPEHTLPPCLTLIMHTVCTRCFQLPENVVAGKLDLLFRSQLRILLLVNSSCQILRGPVGSSSPTRSLPWWPFFTVLT